MKVDKVLNNNVIISLDASGKEQILMGKGIGFQKKPGDDVDQEKINKIFSLKNTALLPKLTELLENIPLDIIMTSERILTYIENNIPGKLHDSIRISLTDHLNFAIQRYKQGILIKNNLLWEIKKFYPKEFQVSKHTIEIINKYLNIALPEDEAGFITLHIINAQLNDDMSQVVEITHIIQEISNIVKYYFKLDYDEDSLSYHRFFTHLKFFAQRMLKHNFIEDSDDSLYKIITEKYHTAFLCTEKISQFLQNKYQRPLTKEETLFLTIHIERIRIDAQTKPL